MDEKFEKHIISMHRTTNRENVEGHDDMSHCNPERWVISNCKNKDFYFNVTNLQEFCPVSQ